MLRTPEDRFRDLPGFPYEPKYLEPLEDYPGCRIHYVDEGPVDAPATWLCLHGEPTWSYLYRKMIPVFLAAGHRVVAPDFFGFGRSDKPAEDSDYSFEFHRDTLLAVVDQLDLRNIVLVCQDWGGLIGLTLPMNAPERYSALVVMNTMLGTGDVALGEGFLGWRSYVKANPDLDAARLMKRSTSGLSDAELAAYNAPYPDASYKAGVKRFPQLVPDNPDAPGASLSREARTWWQNDWQGQSLMAIGMLDPVLGPPVMAELHNSIRNCPPPMEIAEGGHFVQECGEPIAKAALESFQF